MDKNYNIITFIFEITLRSRSQFGNIIKIATIFIKTTIKNLKEVKIMRNYVLKSNLYLYFLI